MASKRRICALLGLLAVGGVARAAAGGDDWKADANARIEQLRKRDAEVLVVDELGRGVPGTAISAAQTAHRFAFGTAVNRDLLFDATYKQFFLEHFEWAVCENESKWFYNEWRKGHVSYADADAIVSVCQQNGKKVRGHNIFWAKEEYTPPWCRTEPDEQFRQDVERRLDSAVPHFSGKFLHWDVNNEMLDGDYFRRRLGSDIEPHMFIRAHQLDPGALLFVNDYSTIECCPSRTQAYIDEIRSLIARGAPVQAIGVQGHYWGATIDPISTLQGLDQLAVLGLPIWITEYDCVNSDANGRADALENLYRAAFSHPSVEGILMWGFWAGSHWRGADAAIVDLDWTLNAAGQRYAALIAEWTTSVPSVATPDGRLAFRGFHGTYAVTDDPGTGARTRSIELVPGPGAQQFVFPLDAAACIPAGEVEDLRVTVDAATATTVLVWQPPASHPGMVLLYDTLRSGDPQDFGAGAVCLETDDGTDREARDPAVPAPERAFYYLVRGANVCPSGEGPLGDRSDGTPRAGRSCP